MLVATQTVGYRLRRVFKMIIQLATILCLLPALQQTNGQSAPSEQAGEAESSRALEGLWPSETLTKSLLIRWSDTVMGDYELSDDQREEIREAVSDRWSGFLQENRSRIQPILNEFLELRLAPEPPSAEQVQSWAERAGPVLDLAGEQMLASNEDFRRVLSPLQRAKFELDALQLNAGIQLAKQRLARWEQGDIDVGSVWQPTGRARDRRKKKQENTGEPAEEAGLNYSPADVRRADKILEELDIWEAYTERFITLFQLYEAQQATALSCLYELKARALTHRKLYRKQIAKLEYRIESGYEPAKKDELIASLKSLYGPIDQMFQELKDRLNGIPTTSQKNAAAIMLPFDPLLSDESERPPLIERPGSPSPAGVDKPK